MPAKPQVACGGRLMNQIRKRWAALVLLTTCLSSLGSYLPARPPYLVAYPQDYRKWVHVKSALIGPQNPVYARYGGPYHIYASEHPLAGDSYGTVPDCSRIISYAVERPHSDLTTLRGRRH